MKLVSKRGKRDTTQKDETKYPETEWSQEQMRALQMATQSNVNDVKVTEEAVDNSFEHLEPPKKSIIKIALLVLFILVLTAAVAFGVWYYWWTNHATFDYELKPVVILYGQNVLSDEFLTQESKDTGITAEFQNSDFAPVQGRVTVPLDLELGWRSLETTATLYVMVPVSEITHEFREELPDIDPLTLLSNAEIARGIDYDIKFSEPPLPLDLYEVGEHTLHLSLNGALFNVKLIIEDTTAPTATAVSVVTNIGEPVTAGEFVTNINDASMIAGVDFVAEPDILSHREQLVEVIISDIFGNSAIITSSLTVILNDLPPVIAGLSLIESMIGKEVEYGRGVTVFDSFGRELEFEVEDSGVDINTLGEYTAYYIAHDLTGNVTTEEFTVRIINADPAAILRQADSILAQILRNDMTTVQRVRAIFTYIRSSMTFDGSDDKKPVSLYEAAHQALDTKRGNSFNYAALAEVLLTRAEIPNMRIFRSADHPVHVWNLIDPNDDDNWYHFDSTPAPVPYREIDNAMHMFTATQAKDFAARIIGRGGNPTMYYEFNPDMYPYIVT